MAPESMTRSVRLRRGSTLAVLSAALLGGIADPATAGYMLVAAGFTVVAFRHARRDQRALVALVPCALMIGVAVFEDGLASLVSHAEDGARFAWATGAVIVAATIGAGALAFAVRRRSRPRSQTAVVVAVAAYLVLVVFATHGAVSGWYPLAHVVLSTSTVLTLLSVRVQPLDRPLTGDGNGGMLAIHAGLALALMSLLPPRADGVAREAFAWQLSGGWFTDAELRLFLFAIGSALVLLACADVATRERRTGVATAVSASLILILPFTGAASLVLLGVWPSFMSVALVVASAVAAGMLAPYADGARAALRRTPLAVAIVSLFAVANGFWPDAGDLITVPGWLASMLPLAASSLAVRFGSRTELAGVTRTTRVGAALLAAALLSVPVLDERKVFTGVPLSGNGLKVTLLPGTTCLASGAGPVLGSFAVSESGWPTRIPVSVEGKVIVVKPDELRSCTGQRMRVRTYQLVGFGLLPGFGPIPLRPRFIESWDAKSSVPVLAQVVLTTRDQQQRAALVLVPENPVPPDLGLAALGRPRRLR